MSNTTKLSDQAASSACPPQERAGPQGFFLGIAISTLIWSLLGIGTTISLSASVAPKLPNMAISQYVQEDGTHQGSLAGAPFVLRFD